MFYLPHGLSHDMSKSNNHIFEGILTSYLLPGPSGGPQSITQWVMMQLDYYHYCKDTYF